MIIMWVDYGYLFQSSIILAVLCLAYWLLLRREKYFRANRFILISIILSVLILPILPMPQGVVGWTGELLGSDAAVPVNNIPAIPDFEMASQEAPATEEGNAVSTAKKTAYINTIDFSEALTAIYLLGVLIMILRFLSSFASLSYLLYTSSRRKEGAYILVTPKTKVAPFSFFHFIVIDRAEYDASTYAQILRHEQIHADQWHTLDILSAELLLIVQWFNPFAWLLRRLIDSNLEYGVDHQLLHEGCDRKAYQYSLLHLADKIAYSTAFGTNYNLSQLKNRIAMMNRKKSPTPPYWKFLLLSLSLVGATLLNSCAKEMLDNQDKDLFVLITKEATPKDLKVLQIQLASYDIGLDIRRSAFYTGGALSELGIFINNEDWQTFGFQGEITPYGIRPVFLHKDLKTGALAVSNLNWIHLKQIEQQFHTSVIHTAGIAPTLSRIQSFTLQELNPWDKELEAEFFIHLKKNGGRGERIKEEVIHLPAGDLKGLEALKLQINDFEVSPEQVRCLVDGVPRYTTLDQVSPTSIFMAKVIYEATPVYDVKTGTWLRDEDKQLTLELASKSYASSTGLITSPSRGIKFYSVE